MKRPVLWTAALLLAAGPAWGHAFLEHAEPAVGGTVRRAPAEAVLAFSDDLDVAASSVKVFDAAGREVDKGHLHAETGDGSRLHLSLAALPPGEYRVTWQVRCLDHHLTQGKFTFQVAPGK